MTRIDPAELSALLDGELPPERTAQVRAAIEADPALRAEYEQLCQSHAAWSEAAASAAFRPQLRAVRGRSLRLLAQGACGALALLVVRFAPKFAPSPAGALLPVAVLAILLGWMLYRSLRATDADCAAVAVRS
jgi:anti-sigma factor RsiW